MSTIVKLIHWFSSTIINRWLEKKVICSPKLQSIISAYSHLKRRCFMAVVSFWKANSCFEAHSYSTRQILQLLLLFTMVKGEKREQLQMLISSNSREDFFFYLGEWIYLLLPCINLLRKKSRRNYVRNNVDNLHNSSFSSTVTVSAHMLDKLTLNSFKSVT